MQTYLFYDIETTGLNKAFDQILQFAAIRTTLKLEELDRYDIKVKLNSDCIPSPYATITHHIGIKETTEGIDEYTAIKKIHAILNAPGTISVGYNTLGFDDEFLRFAFYRNLLPPYTHQYANGCGRMDIYAIALMYYLFHPSVIEWPELNNKPTLKLEHINNANQFVTGRSHQAMIDVEVTLALARRFYQVHEMWEYIIHYFNKKTDEARQQQLCREFSLDHPEGIMLDGTFGADANYHSPVLYLGEHQHYKNQHLWLRLDSDLSNNPWVVRKKWGEPAFILPPKPRFLKNLTQPRQTLTLANKKWLKEDAAFFKKMIKTHCSYVYPIYPEADADSILYIKGFWSESENAFCRQFHAATPQDKVKITALLPDSTLRTLATRLLGRHYPQALTPLLKMQFETYMTKVNGLTEQDTLIDFQGKKRLTPEAARMEINNLYQERNLSTEQLQLLEELNNYLGKYSVNT